MSEVQGWVYTICGGALICGIVSALCPSKSYEKAIQLLLGLFMLFCFLTPITLDWELPTVDLEGAEQRRQEAAERIGETAERQLAADLDARVQAETDRVLLPYDIAAGEAALSVETGEGGRVLVTVTLPYRLRDSGQAIRSQLGQALGAEVELQYEAERREGESADEK